MSPSPVLYELLFWRFLSRGWVPLPNSLTPPLVIGIAFLDPLRHRRPALPPFLARALPLSCSLANRERGRSAQGRGRRRAGGGGAAFTLALNEQR